MARKLETTSVAKKGGRKPIVRRDSNSSATVDDPEPLVSLPSSRPPQKRGKKRVMVQNESSSSDETILPLALCDDDSGDEETFSDLEPLEFDINVNVNDYCAVKFHVDEKSEKVKHYIGLIQEHDLAAGVYLVRFLRKTATGNRFTFPAVQDVAWVQKESIVTKLKPIQLGTTSRQQRFFSFQDVDKFSLENLY